MRTVSSTIPRKAVMCESEQCSGEWKSAYFFSVGFEVFSWLSAGRCHLKRVVLVQDVAACPLSSHELQA